MMDFITTQATDVTNFITAHLNEAGTLCLERSFVEVYAPTDILVSIWAGF